MSKKRLLISLAFVLLHVLLGFAQQLTVTVDSVGKLAGQLTDSIRFKISELKVCGPLNSNDLKVLQQIANRVKPKNPKDVLLTELLS